MHLKNLKLINFRNIRSCDLEFSPGLNIFYGNNAQGKTNLLESIFILSTMRSHRTLRDNEIIQFNEDFYRIESRLDDNTEINYSISRKGEKLRWLNGEKITAMNLVGVLNAIIFAPDDSLIIKGSPNYRRRYFNMELSKLDSEFLKDLKLYNKVLKQRNMLLKNTVDEKLLIIYEKQLADSGSRIIYKRRNFIKELSEFGKEICNEMNNNDGEMKILYETCVPQAYETVEKIREFLEISFENKRVHDIMGKITGIGPHRDEYSFCLCNKKLKKFGSQGQVKSVVLALKLATMEYIYKRKNYYPILLLDDITSELDGTRLEFFLKYILSRGQILLTTTGINNFSRELLSGARIYKVAKGELKVEKV